MTSPIFILGSDRRRDQASKQIEILPDDEEVTVAILLRPPPDSPPVPDLDHWQNTPVTEHQFLSSEDYARIYGATSSDLDKVRAFAEGQGMTVLDSHAGRRTVKVKGTSKQISTAFGVKLQRYESPLPQKSASTNPADIKTHIHRGYDGLLSVPQDLDGIVTAVIGLDDRRIAASKASTGDPPDSMPLSVPKVADYYSFPNAGASDQVIGLLELEPAGYQLTDLTKLYFPSLPPGFNKTPHINAIPATPGSTNLGPTTSNALETVVDISVSGAVAQGATINVYFAHNSEYGIVEFFSRVLVPEEEAQPTVVSNSYGAPESASIGSPTTPGSYAYITTTLFRHLSYQGINIFVASGDAGANDGVPGGTHVDYPSSNPWVTSCGGTILGNPTGSPAVFQEWAWSDQTSGSVFLGATGGGSSAIFPIPPYQTEAGIKEIKDSSGKSHTNRFVPDIAGMNAMTGFYINGQLITTAWGTSWVAPLYAGLTACIQSALGKRLGPLNSILYPLGKVIFNDVTYGNNDSGGGDAYFTATAGYDACTGWGSIDGTKFLNALVKLHFHQRLHFEVEHHAYDFEKVKHISSYPAAFKVVLEGFTPNAVGSQRPTLNGPFAALNGVTIIVGPPTPETASKPFSPQRITYTCGISFATNAVHTLAHGGIFPDPGEHPIVEFLAASINVLGETLVAHKTEFTLGFHGKEEEFTGKITGIVYDRFGDFKGFLLSTEPGKEKMFRNGEKGAEEVVRLAWEKRILISVLVDRNDQSPRSIILRAFSSQGLA